MTLEYKHTEKQQNGNFKQIEQHCLIVTMILNLALAIVEIVYFFLTARTSILFDGIFSGVMTITTIIAFALTFFIKKKSFNYPFGKSVFDNVFSLFKNLLLIVISIVFIIDASMNLASLVNHTFVYEPNNNNSLYISYVVVSCGMSLIITTIYYLYSRKLNHHSIIIKAEIKASIFDFCISFGIGIALLVSSFVANDEYIKEIIDKSITLILSVVMLPINAKSFVIDLLIICGYRMYKNEEKDLMDHLGEKAIVDIYIQRHNDQKIFMITINLKDSKNKLETLKQKISDHIYDHYSKDTLIYYLV